MFKKILIIDDETLLVNMYKTALTTQGYEVSSAESGDEGLVKIKSVKPDLVLLDIMLPKVTGPEILDAMKANPELAKIPVIMLTNLTWTPDPKTLLAKGALDVWLKANTRPKDLLLRVNNFFNKRKEEN